MPNLLDDPFFSGGMRLFLEFLDSVPELSKYKTFFKSIENDYIDRLRDVMLEYHQNAQPYRYYTLCHGDFHLRNMMFKHNKTDGSLEDCQLVDFQMSNLTPISIDIIYSIYMLMGAEDRKNNYKELIGFYFNTFIDTLTKIGYKDELPTLEKFWKQLADHKYYGNLELSTILFLIKVKLYFQIFFY